MSAEPVRPPKVRKDPHLRDLDIRLIQGSCEVLVGLVIEVNPSDASAWNNSGNHLWAHPDNGTRKSQAEGQDLNQDKFFRTIQFRTHVNDVKHYPDLKTVHPYFVPVVGQNKTGGGNFLTAQNLKNESALPGYLNTKTGGQWWNFRKYRPKSTLVEYYPAGDGIARFTTKQDKGEESYAVAESGLKRTQASLQGEEPDQADGQGKRRRTVDKATSAMLCAASSTTSFRRSSTPTSEEAAQPACEELSALTKHLARPGWENGRPEMKGRTIFQYIQAIPWATRTITLNESIAELVFFHEALRDLYGEQAPAFDLLRIAKNEFDPRVSSKFRKSTRVAKCIDDRKLDLDAKLPAATHEQISTRIINRVVREIAETLTTCQELEADAESTDSEDDLLVQADLASRER